MKELTSSRHSLKGTVKYGDWVVYLFPPYSRGLVKRVYSDSVVVWVDGDKYRSEYWSIESIKPSEMAQDERR